MQLHYSSFAMAGAPRFRRIGKSAISAGATRASVPACRNKDWINRMFARGAVCGPGMAVGVRALCECKSGDKLEARWLPGRVASVEDGGTPNSVRVTVHVDDEGPLPEPMVRIGVASRPAPIRRRASFALARARETNKRTPR